MNIALFGATGRVGNELLKKLLHDGHHVTALTRKKDLLTPHQHLTIVEGDATSFDHVTATVAGADFVFSALGTDKQDVISRSMVHILPAMRQHDVSTVVTIGTAGILDSKVEPGKLRFHSSESNRKLTRAAEDHCKAYFMLKQSDRNWAIVCPTYLPDGERVGAYRTERNTLPDNPSSISIFDTADFAYSLLHSREWDGTRIGITY